MTAAPKDTGGGVTTEHSGFRASLNATLPDLVQLECLAQTRGSFRVTSGRKIGYLVFEAGQLVHAISGDVTGESAALEILRWQEGTFEPCNVGWPDAPTISSTWQNLLLLAAQARDESSGGRRVVNLPTRPAKAGSVPPPATTVMSRPEPSMCEPAVDGFVRVDPSGKVLTARGKSEGLEAVAAYAVRLADLIGHGLGLEPFMALEGAQTNKRLFVHRDASGNVLALRADAEVELGSLRQRIGLGS
jgi:hypothetical protein